MTTPEELPNSTAAAIGPVIKTGDCRHRYLAMFSIGAALLSVGLSFFFLLLRLASAAIALDILFVSGFIVAAVTNFCFCRCQFDYTSKTSRPATPKEAWTLVSILLAFVCIWVPMALFKPTQIICLFLMSCGAIFSGYKMVAFASRQGRLFR